MRQMFEISCNSGNGSDQVKFALFNKFGSFCLFTYKPLLGQCARKRLTGLKITLLVGLIKPGGSVLENSRKPPYFINLLPRGFYLNRITSKLVTDLIDYTLR